MSAKNGKPCRKCGQNEWRANGRCAPCARERQRRWSAANPDKVAVKARRWRLNHPEKNTERKRKYKQANPEKEAERSRRWKRKNPNKVREQERRRRFADPEGTRRCNRRWHQNNIEKVHERCRNWRLSNPDRANAIKHRYRTRKTAAGGSYTVAEWKALLAHYGYRCLCCGRDDVKLAADHIVPVAKGGSSNIDNIQPLCNLCNSRKGTQTIDYRPEMGLGRWIQRKLFG